MSIWGREVQDAETQDDRIWTVKGEDAILRLSVKMMSVYRKQKEKKMNLESGEAVRMIFHTLIAIFAISCPEMRNEHGNA